MLKVLGHDLDCVLTPPLSHFPRSSSPWTTILTPSSETRSLSSKLARSVVMSWALPLCLTIFDPVLKEKIKKAQPVACLYPGWLKTAGNSQWRVCANKELPQRAMRLKRLVLSLPSLMWCSNRSLLTADGDWTLMNQTNFFMLCNIWPARQQCILNLPLMCCVIVWECLRINVRMWNTI